MNIFAVHPDPVKAALELPEKHIVKMPLETAQMLSVILSPWHLNLGPIRKADGTLYKTEKGAYRNHPCTIWAASSLDNLCWLIVHGIALCIEYNHLYKKDHGSYVGIIDSISILQTHQKVSDWGDIAQKAQTVTAFARAMPEPLKSDHTITDTQAYQKYIREYKPWAPTNYKRDPSRKPTWLP